MTVKNKSIFGGTIFWSFVLVFTTLKGNGLDFPMHFDFAPKKQMKSTQANLVTEKTQYEKRIGYGLLTDVDSTFVPANGSLQNPLTGDGMISKRPIVFRVDIPPGDYNVELFMDGGKRSFWIGEIRANGILLADTLKQINVSFEGEEPPAYWTLFRPFRNTDECLVLSIFCSNQASTITGLSLYRSDLGPVHLVDGKCLAVRHLRAPNAQVILDIINRGDPAGAQRFIDQIPDTLYRFEKAVLLLSMAGRLELEDPRICVELAQHLLEKEYRLTRSAESALHLRMTQLYVTADTYYKMGGWDWAREWTGLQVFSRLNLAGQEYLKLSALNRHPLAHRVVWNLGKLAFHGWVEQHDREQKDMADRCFARLRPYYPDLRLLRMYSGERLFSAGLDTTDVYSEAPLWAKKANLAMKQLKEIIRYWVERRQSSNGEFGGKYDDDVEMLRWWPVAILASNDATALQGMKKLVNGVWNSGWITNGYSTKVRDVEHSAEPVSDTQPMMIGLDYGNPVYVERCMESIKGLYGLWTGVNAFGHRHFKSSWYSYNRMDTEPPKDCDVEMNTQTVKAARWLAWYNRHPVAMKFMREWTDAWLEDCKRTDKGKPYGIVPAAVRYGDDAIGGHADNWHHPGMFWSYYDFQGGTRMLHQFLAAYELTGDAKYLEPIEVAVRIASKYSPDQVRQAEIGSEAWAAGIFLSTENFPAVVEKWWMFTRGETGKDFVFRCGSDFVKFQMTGDRKHLVNGCQRILDGILFNRELITTEGYFTDRIEIGNINTRDIGDASHLESMYAGSALQECFYPFYSITWEGLGSDFAAAVLKSDPRGVRVLLYNLADSTKKGSAHFWMLAPGTYAFEQGPDINQDGEADTVLYRNTFDVLCRSESHAVQLPPRIPQVVEVRQIKNRGGAKELPDLAITQDEWKTVASPRSDTVTIAIPVHNIGIQRAMDVQVELRKIEDGKATTVAVQRIPRIDAPLDLNPKQVAVQFHIRTDGVKTCRYQIWVDPRNAIREITETNNRVTVEWVNGQ